MKTSNGKLNLLVNNIYNTVKVDLFSTKHKNLCQEESLGHMRNCTNTTNISCTSGSALLAEPENLFAGMFAGASLLLGS